jgi:hypothetical protein
MKRISLGWRRPPFWREVHCEDSISCEIHELPEMSLLEGMHWLGWRRIAIVEEVAMRGVL